MLVKLNTYQPSEHRRKGRDRCLRGMGYLQSEESKSLERLLERALVDHPRRVDLTVVEVVILSREDEGREPEVREDPCYGAEVALVFVVGGEEHGGEVEDGVDDGLLVVSMMSCMMECVGQ